MRRLLSLLLLLSLLGLLAAVVVPEMSYRENHASPPPAAPPPSAPAPPDPAALIAGVDTMADAARAETNPSDALDAWDRTDKALTYAEGQGATEAQVKPRRAVIAKEQARLECVVMGPMRAGVVRESVLRSMASVGMVGNVRVSGKCSDSITIEWALWTDVTVLQFQEGPINRTLFERGFKHVRLQAFDQYWSYNYE